VDTTFLLWDNTEIAIADATTMDKIIRGIIVRIYGVVWFAGIDLFREFLFDVVAGATIVNLAVTFNHCKMFWCCVEYGADVSKVISCAVNGPPLWLSVNGDA
jgi:hypothetical protein